MKLKMATKNVRQEYMECGKIEPRKKRTQQATGNH